MIHRRPRAATTPPTEAVFRRARQEQLYRELRGGREDAAGGSAYDDAAAPSDYVAARRRLGARKLPEGYSTPE